MPAKSKTQTKTQSEPVPAQSEPTPAPVAAPAAAVTTQAAPSNADIQNYIQQVQQQYGGNNAQSQAAIAQAMKMDPILGKVSDKPDGRRNSLGRNKGGSRLFSRGTSVFSGGENKSKSKLFL